MKKNRWLLGLLGAFALTLCFSCKGQEAVKELEKVRTQACECKDQECANQALDDFGSVMKKHADTQATEGTIKEAEKVMTELIECAQKAGASQEKMMQLATDLQKL